MRTNPENLNPEKFLLLFSDVLHLVSHNYRHLEICNLTL